MNRRDLHDGYAPFEVRPALRRDPKPDHPAAIALCLLSFAIVAAIFATWFYLGVK